MKLASFLLVTLAAVPCAAQVGSEKHSEYFGLSKKKSGRGSASLATFKEEDNYWSRLLQDTSMSVTPPPTPIEPPCEVDAEVTCTSGEGIECGLIEPVDPETEPENCLSTVTYSYEVRNIGPNTLAITSADVQFKDDTAEDILPLFEDTELAPGESQVVRQDRTVDLCAAGDCATTFEVNARADNGKGCQETDIYVLSPGRAPTPEPKFCKTDVKITCGSVDGVECNAVEAPPLQCPSDLSTVRFRYTGQSCEGTNNVQDDDTCVDMNGGPPTDTEVLVTCDVPSLVDGETVSPSDTVTITAPDGGVLPTNMKCTVSSTDSSIIYQEVTMNTQSEFFLKDRYGSLEVERCNDSDCIVDVLYLYTLINTGVAPINLTSVIRDRNGETAELIGFVAQRELDIGESTIIPEPDEVDYCVESTIVTTVSVFSQGEECAVRPVRRGLRQRDVVPFDTGGYDLLVQVETSHFPRTSGL